MKSLPINLSSGKALVLVADPGHGVNLAVRSIVLTSAAIMTVRFRDTGLGPIPPADLVENTQANRGAIITKEHIAQVRAEEAAVRNNPAHQARDLTGELSVGPGQALVLAPTDQPGGWFGALIGGLAADVSGAEGGTIQGFVSFD